MHPKGETAEQISASTGHDKDKVLGALLGDPPWYSVEDALVTISLVTMSEEESYGQKFLIFTATSDGEDIDKLLRDYALNNNLLIKCKNYLIKLEKKLTGQKKE